MNLLVGASILFLCPIHVVVVEILTDSLCKVLIQTFNIIESDIYEGSSLCPFFKAAIFTVLGKLTLM